MPVDLTAGSDGRGGPDAAGSKFGTELIAIHFVVPLLRTRSLDLILPCAIRLRKSTKERGPTLARFSTQYHSGTVPAVGMGVLASGPLFAWAAWGGGTRAAAALGICAGALAAEVTTGAGSALPHFGH